jgi:catechol 2,3-dioxygenase-like lactoylglutathione lyase family enzyme
MTTVKEAGPATVDMKLEVVVIPVSDAARAEQFYRKLGWRQDDESIGHMCGHSNLRGDHPCGGTKSRAGDQWR